MDALSGYAVSQRLCEDGQFMLLRARRNDDGLPVMLLAARERRRDSLARLEHAYGLRTLLDPAFAAMPLALADGERGPVLVIADSGASPLSLLPPAPMPARDFLALALNITGALAQLHQRGIVHQDLRPEHVLADPSSGRVLLTGFGNAARAGTVPRADCACQSASLPYMAPEQTGRAPQAVDLRTDLYSLGVVLYRLLCGQLPFTARDTLQWIDCHVHQPPRACEASIDPCLAGIVGKLLAKFPRQRYQNVAALQADLAHYLALLQASDRPLPFALGRSDGARPRTAATLVGRAVQLALLGERLQHAAAGATLDPILVSGAGGCGKSSLLAAFQKSAGEAGAQILAIRFEQHLAEVPYAALRADLEVQPGWRRQAGADAGLLAHALPTLGRAARAGLDEGQAHARLPGAFRRLLAGLAGPGAPLLLCLDDLQWADPASLALLAAVAAPPLAAHVMVVASLRGAPRSPEAAGVEAWMARHGMSAEPLPLALLSHEDSSELVALALDCDREQCAPLSDLVHARCRGNPLFTAQLLARLAESGLLRWASDGGRWQWDGAAIAQLREGASLVAVLAARLQQLPRETLHVAGLMACLGRHGEQATLARVAGMSSAELDEMLWPAERLGLIRRASGRVMFLHDRVREVALSLQGDDTLAERHRHIGRILARGARGDTLFAAAFQLARDLPALGPRERRLLAKVATLAGHRARAMLAFDAARISYGMAAQAATERGWDDSVDTMLDLQLALAECEQHCGLPEAAEVRLAAVDARIALDAGCMTRAALVLRRLEGLRTMGRHAEAAGHALAALGWFGLQFPERGKAIDAALAGERCAIHEAAVCGQGAAADAAMVTAICAESCPAVEQALPGLYPLFVARALHFVLRHGGSDMACTLYARYAVTLATDGALETALHYAQAARSSALSPLLHARVEMLLAAFLDCWREPLGQTLERLDAAARACQDDGDLTHAGYAINVSLWHSLEAGMPLSEVAARARRHQALARGKDREQLQALLQCHLQLVEALQGEGGAAAARATLALMQPAGGGIARTCCLVLRQTAAYMLGLHREARAAAQAVADECQFVFGAVHEGSHRFMHALTLAALYSGATAAQRPAMLETMRAIAHALHQQALRCAANFSGRYLLVAAELARVERRDLDAMRSYDAALALARAAGLQQIEALAADLAAQCHDTLGFGTSAQAYAAEAWHAYRRWGSKARMAALEYRFPALATALRPDMQGAAGDGDETDAALALCRELASRADAGALPAILLRHALRCSGASRALLLLAREQGMRCVAQAEAGLHACSVELMDLPMAAAPLPVPLATLVLRTGHALAVDDALSHALLSGDAFVDEHRLRSLLCVPLIAQGIVAGLLYLEHGLVAGVFNERRIRLTELAAAQAALVLERDRLLIELDLAWLRQRGQGDHVDDDLLMDAAGRTRAADASCDAPQ